MNESQRKHLINEAQELWNANQGLGAGEVIYEHIPRELRSLWAVDILKFVYEYFPPADDIEAVIKFGETPSLWSPDRYLEAHEIVDVVNRFPHQEVEPFEQTIYTLAVNVGKVVYNAQHYPAPFDHDAGWQIGKTLKRIEQEIENEGFVERAWKVFCKEQYILLDEPIVCHPACSTCYASSL
jgi:hypothetical protein